MNKLLAPKPHINRWRALVQEFLQSSIKRPVLWRVPETQCRIPRILGWQRRNLLVECT
jgi:hypothetical protein